LLVAFCYIVAFVFSLVVEEHNLKPSAGSKVVVEIYWGSASFQSFGCKLTDDRLRSTSRSPGVTCSVVLPGRARYRKFSR
jgi:hypothetical protein